MAESSFQYLVTQLFYWTEYKTISRMHTMAHPIRMGHGLTLLVGSCSRGGRAGPTEVSSTAGD